MHSGILALLADHRDGGDDVVILRSHHVDARPGRVHLPVVLERAEELAGATPGALLGLDQEAAVLRPPPSPTGSHARHYDTTLSHGSPPRSDLASLFGPGPVRDPRTVPPQTKDARTSYAKGARTNRRPCARKYCRL